MSLDAERAQSPPRSDADRRALAAITLATAQTLPETGISLMAPFLCWAITGGAAQLARVNFQPLPSSVVTVSGTQIANIKG